MTLIAKTTRQHIPFLVADILFTSEEGKDIPVPIDTGDVKDYIKTMQYKPHQYAQKLHIINPDVCIAMAGDYEEMKAFVSEFRKEIGKHDQIETSIVDNILLKLEKKVPLTISSFIICVARRENNTIKYFELSHPKDKFVTDYSNTFERITASGSGAVDFIEFHQDEGKYNPAISGLDATCMLNIEMLARMMANDIATLEFFHNNWGCGFESIYCANQGFKKIENIAYLYLTANKDSDGNLTKIRPQKVFHIKYEDENMIYSCLNIDNFITTEDNTHVHFFNTNTINNVYVIEPIDAEKTGSIDVKDYSFNTEIIAVGMALESPEQEFDIDGAFLLRNGNSIGYNPNGITLISLEKALIGRMLIKHKQE